MANRRKEIPSFVSIEVGKVRSIAESMEDADWSRWSKKALDDLTMGCVRNDVDPIVKDVYDKSKNSMDREYQRKKKWYEDNKKSPQDATNGNAVDDRKVATSCDTLKADGDTREDSQAKQDGSAITRNETRHIDALEPSANIYEQESSISTDDPQPEGLTGPSHGGSVASLEARESQALESRRRTGGSSVRGMAKVAQPPVRPRASFRNKEEFIQWAIDDGLDPVDANECWEATEERGGKDADGNTVKNMKAFARQWCRTRANNRRTA